MRPFFILRVTSQFIYDILICNHDMLEESYGEAMKIRNNCFAVIAVAVMAIVLIVNTVISSDCNRLMILLTGGGRLVDHMGATHADLYGNLELWRLVSYGYLQPAIWHFAANALALWYVGLYLEKKIGLVRFLAVYHVGMIAACAVFLLIFPKGCMYGASPAVFCCLGMMVVWVLKDRRLAEEYKNLRGSRYLLGYMILSNFLSAGTFVVHLLGFCAGLIFGLVVKRKSPSDGEKA